MAQSVTSTAFSEQMYFHNEMALAMKPEMNERMAHRTGANSERATRRRTNATKYRGEIMSLCAAFPLPSESRLPPPPSWVIFQGKAQGLSEPWGSWWWLNITELGTGVSFGDPAASRHCCSAAQRCVADFSGRKDSDSLFTAIPMQRTHKLFSHRTAGPCSNIFRTSLH